MPHILLIGAGFSRNWGGLLASEVFNALIGHPAIRDDQYLRGALFNNRASGGFENALADVQRAFLLNPGRHDQHLQRMQEAVRGVFQDMNNAFLQRPSMEFQQHIDRMMRTFLKRFDAIFTLNQDILLEHHYVRHLDLAGPPWRGGQLPGMRRIPNQDYVGEPSWGRDTWVPIDAAAFTIDVGLQPIFKLHGSTNWRNAQGGQLLVIGGDKSAAIQSHRVLTWSFGWFEHYLSQPNTKLMVIGYGFKDQHINAPIIRSVANHGLTFFVVDALGPDVVRYANPSLGGAIYAPTELDDAFRNGLIGASQRSLTETFNNDDVSHAQLMRFFT